MKIWILFIACVISSTEATLSKCQQFHASTNTGMIGAYVPQCKETGEFEEKQCWGSTGYCWCVDEDGKEIPGTKIRGSPDCSKKATLSKCQQLHASTNTGMIGAYVPQCKETGEFEEKQCWGSTGYCWCVDEDGKEIPGTKIRGSPDCSKKATLSKCQQLHASTNTGMIGAYVPQCKETGEFEEKQCWGSTGYCWCVDEDGKEIPGTKIRGSPDCSKKATLTLCQLLQTIIVNVPGWCGPPSCKADGSFDEVQCCASTGECYCVDKKGTELEGTRQKGRPSCERHLSPCEEARLQAHSNSLRVGMFLPHCLEDGSYNPVQCWASTGYCWCVDEAGVKVSGSDVRFKHPTC